MFKKIVYLVVLIILSLCVVERIRVSILEKCFYPSMYITAQKHSNYKLYLRCGQIKYMAKDYDMAQKIFTLVLRKATTSEHKKEKLQAFYYLGNTFYEMGKYDDALKAYAVVLKNEPDNRKALRKFSRIKMAKEEYVSLYPFIVSYIKAKPNDSFGYSEQCAVLTRLNKIVPARKACEKAIEIRRGNARAHYDYAVLLKQMGFKDLAEKEYQEAIANQRKIKSREELEKMLNIQKSAPTSGF